MSSEEVREEGAAAVTAPIAEVPDAPAAAAKPKTKTVRRTKKAAATEDAPVMELPLAEAPAQAVPAQAAPSFVAADTNVAPVTPRGRYTPRVYGAATAAPAPAAEVAQPPFTPAPATPAMGGPADYQTPQSADAPAADGGPGFPPGRPTYRQDTYNGGAGYEDANPADASQQDPRNFEGRNPLRFRGGRAQMRAERSMVRGRNLRPGMPGYVNGQTAGADGNYNPQQQGQQNQQGQGQQGQQGQGRGRREYDLLALEAMGLPELHRLAEELGIEVPPLKKDDLIFAIIGKQAEVMGNVLKRGILEILPDGKGFLRCSGYLPDDGDVYVSQSQIKRFNLKTGDTVTGTVRQPKEMERYHGLLRVEAINGLSPEVMKTRKEFEKLTPIFPTEKFKLETEQHNITARIIDLISPIGKGQRGLIVAPPKAGKTSLIKNIANSIMANHPEVHLIVLLIDERPEEVTDIQRSVRGEVVASTFDETPENHMRVADMAMEKAKRLVEMKQDVVILLDSITRLSRASNLVVSPSGRTLSGGLDPAAMYRPKRMFGAARNMEEGGSLTILATTLVDTGSRMDDMIFEEFKGTGNLDLVLDRSLFDQRIFPAVDINKSGTRRDDLLMSKEELAATYHLRRTLAALDNDKAVPLLIDRLKNTKNNEEFMQIVAKSARTSGSQG